MELNGFLFRFNVYMFILERLFQEIIFRHSRGFKLFFEIFNLIDVGSFAHFPVHLLQISRFMSFLGRLEFVLHFVFIWTRIGDERFDMFVHKAWFMFTIGFELFLLGLILIIVVASIKNLLPRINMECWN